MILAAGLMLTLSTTKGSQEQQSRNNGVRQRPAERWCWRWLGSPAPAVVMMMMMMAIRGTVAQRCQAEHDAVGRGAGGAAVITSVQYQVQVWRLRSRMRYRGACETLAHVLEALDYSRRHTRSVLRPLIAARPRSAPMRMQLRNQREIIKCGR
jgi:hypothetical protein